jgi:predicted dehydrogenase
MSTTTKNIRVGLIGYGWVGKVYHAPLIRSVPGLDLAIIGSSRPEAVHADIPNVKVIPPEEVPAHPDLDLIVIATPNDSHHPLAAAAIRAGKHVVVDKPFTVTLDETRDLLRLAAEHNVVLSAFHNRRYDSEVLATRAVIASGALGEVVHFETHIDRFRPQVRERWRENPGPGSGLWFDLGPHLIDQTLNQFGLPDSINATITIARPGGQTDDWAHVILNYPTHRAILQATLLAAGGGVPRTVVHGTKASWAKFGGDYQEKRLVAGILPGTPGFADDPEPGILYDGETIIKPGDTGTPGNQTRISGPTLDQSAYYAAIRNTILHNTPNPVPPAQALHVMTTLIASFESAASGRTIPFQWTPEDRAAWSLQQMTATPPISES